MTSPFAKDCLFASACKSSQNVLAPPSDVLAPASETASGSAPRPMFEMRSAICIEPSKALRASFSTFARLFATATAAVAGILKSHVGAAETASNSWTAALRPPKQRPVATESIAPSPNESPGSKCDATHRDWPMRVTRLTLPAKTRYAHETTSPSATTVAPSPMRASVACASRSARAARLQALKSDGSDPFAAFARRTNCSKQAMSALHRCIGSRESTYATCFHHSAPSAILCTRSSTASRARRCAASHLDFSKARAYGSGSRPSTRGGALAVKTSTRETAELFLSKNEPGLPLDEVVRFVA
ncbi:hypothetical protein M885DRAFT_536236 [Pelagophyceae sp. CCMP2097]|nr:hypothetical protein M885DRAFT_536236 [Pelagophyceae sp. CCMP2097]|mmetsp:Transcript_26780/g.90156  ORF Transcript_26780/g.90156 Transcript_26780/m.90156 type:complete len:302 (+) Transcript_26780:1692-2597(+)